MKDNPSFEEEIVLLDDAIFRSSRLHPPRTWNRLWRSLTGNELDLQ